MAVTNPPVFLQAGSHPAEDVRRLFSALVKDGEGTVLAADLAVVEQGTPDMTVDVAAGRAFIKGTESTFQGTYFVESRAIENLTITASDASNPRIDLVVAKIEDSAESGATDAWSLAVVAGTPAASPAAPTQPANSILLATVAVAALASTIVDANITDNRVHMNPGYQLVKFTASSSFVKANYPWATTASVRVVAGGGASGGLAATTGSTQFAMAGGGGGGGYAEARIATTAMSASETVTVGTGGTGTATTGNTGGASSFGSNAVAAGGVGGSVGAQGTSQVSGGSGGAGGAASAGDIQISGGGGASQLSGVASGQIKTSPGGGSQLAGSHASTVTTATQSSAAGLGFGGGGMGGTSRNASGAASNGAAGADGIVIVELFG